jgi:glycosyltransferase involved in cell wall biosynthesis
MIIAVNTRFLLNDYLEGYGYFLYETFRRIVRDHPEHEFIFLFDRPFDQRFVFGKNVIPVVVSPVARHPILWRWWYNVKVPVVVRKYKADIFVSADSFCSLTARVPQCLVLHDLSFLHYPGFIKKSHLRFYKKYIPRFLQKARSVATVSEFSKNDIISTYKTTDTKIDVVYSAAKDIFKPVSFEKKMAVKEKYTEEKEYFLYVGAIHPRKNLMNLLKAFSLFKKRQQSNMKLVIAGRLAWLNEGFVESIKTYKYRDDVVLTGYIEETELVDLTASAWALVYPSLFEGFGVPVLEAMKCEVPVLTSSGTSMQEIAGNAAAYFDATDIKDIADKMMLVYRDETFRKKLIENGKTISQQYSWDITAGLLWQTILKAIA